MAIGFLKLVGFYMTHKLRVKKDILSLHSFQIFYGPETQKSVLVKALSGCEGILKKYNKKSQTLL